MGSFNENGIMFEFKGTSYILSKYIQILHGFERNSGIVRNRKCMCSIVFIRFERSLLVLKKKNFRNSNVLDELM